MSTTPTPQWADIARVVDESDGAFTITMGVLRTMAGAQRINDKLVGEISQELHRRGYGHRPERLPIRQEDHVLIYRLGSLGAEVFGALEEGMHKKSDFSAVTEAIRMINAANREAGDERFEALMEMSPQPRRRRTDRKAR